MGSRLFDVTQEMAGCNGFGIKPLNQWLQLSPEFDVAELEAQAAKLDGEALELFVDGEEQEIAQLTESLKLTELNNFLDCVFDGYLHEHIAI